MKHFLLALFTIIAASQTYAQTFDELLKKGKAMVRDERKSLNAPRDYKPAISVLEQAVKMQPDNAEAHYFLGAAYDYDNSPDGSNMDHTNKDKVMNASNEMEKVIQLSPKYTGDIVALDPYSKLSSIWGGLAYTYIVRNDHDSARWAFAEGKRRGAFSDFALKYYRLVLQDCSKNALFFCYGDFPTMNMWYLQEMENLRPDITFICLTMLQVPWYTEFLYKKDPALFSSEMEADDTVLYKKWREKIIKVPIKNTGKFFTWDVITPYGGDYLYRSVLELVDIVVQNKFNRVMYVAKGTPEEEIPGLKHHLQDHVISDIIVPEKDPKRGKMFYDRLKTFPYEMLHTINMNNSQEASCEYTLRAELITGIYQLLKENKETEAKQFYTLLLQYFPVSTFPYENDQVEDYMDRYKEHFGE